MNEVFTTKRDWLIHAAKAGINDVIRVHPRDGLTVKMVIEALSAQKILLSSAGRPAWHIVDHGSCMLMQRRSPPNPDSQRS